MIETIQVKEIDGGYSCDIGINKKEWLNMLQEQNMPDKYKDALLKFYYMPEHRGTCTTVSNEIGGDAQSLNSYITKTGQYVQKRLNRFQVVRSNGNPCYWIIPMGEGKDLPKGDDGVFEWQLRPELVEAIHDYLYWHLVERYKEVRKEIPLNGEKYEEIYKWNLITASQGKTPFEVVAAHVAHSGKAELGGFTNLIDAVRDNKALKYLVETKPSEFEEVLNHLADDNVDLNKRLLEFKNEMAALLPQIGYNSKANDERTASTILTCLNPEKYTIYKYDVYRFLCKCLGVSHKPSGQCLAHFLELLKPLCELTKNDEQLQQLVVSALEGKRQSDLLLAQDVLWVLFSEFPEKLGFLQPLIWRKKKRVWLWGGNAAITDMQSLGCGSSTNKIKDFRPYTSADNLKKALLADKPDIDKKLPDAYWKFMREVSVDDILVAFETRKENGKQYHVLYGWGTFTSDVFYDKDDNNPMRRKVEWHLPFLDVPIEDRTMGDSLFFQGTTEKQANRIIELLNINSGKNMESKYQKYIDLLEANKNLILTGAPGTGKTFMAVEMAKEIIFNPQHPIMPMDVLRIALDSYREDVEAELQYGNLLKEFNERFPMEYLNKMSLEDYCIGKGDDNKDNFCFWMERKLKPLGYYFPGSSRAYLLYWNKSEEEYKVHGYLKNEPNQNPAELMKVLSNDIFRLVNEDKPQDYTGKFGDSFILKILNTYYPDKYAPVNSKVHINHIISLFDIPCQSQDVFERNKAIFRFFKEQTKGKNISPFGFMRVLYNNFNIRDGEMIEHGIINNKGEYRFVQFHPSYDYTDFVEGLRPVQDEGIREIGFKREDGIFKSLCSIANRNPNRKYVLIIDEINRGEVSKIFGELFFSIDPGYRGEKIKVQTQYQNLIADGNEFQDGFFVPENVYIIGTMNDIDRSVESMDFAMRRRFAWQEVTAEESYANMIENDSEFALVKDEIKTRMFNLNKAIAETEGLDETYQIGAAYFRKYLDYNDKANPFDCLWENHLKGLLFEYLRGNRRAKELLEKLHKAYNKTSANEQPAHTDEG